MDTPEGMQHKQQQKQQQMDTPHSRSEDSPYSIYINNLSPIKPVKSVHIGQTFPPESFSCIPSVFTSPHVKVQKESRFLTRCHHSEFSKPDVSGDESNLCTEASTAVKLPDCSVYAHESCNVRYSLGEVTKDAPEECSTLPIKQTDSFQFDCGSPNHNTTPCYGVKTDHKLVLGGTSLVPFVHGGQEEGKSSFITKIVSDGMHQLDYTEDEAIGCDWVNLISDAEGLLIYGSATEVEACEGLDKKFGDHDATFLTSQLSNIPEDNNDVSQKAQPESSLGPCVQNSIEEPPLNYIGEVGDQKETDYTPHILSACQNMPAMSDQSEIMNDETGDCIPLVCKVDSKQQRGMRRRCLVFEGCHKNLYNASSNMSSTALIPHDLFASDDRHPTSFKLGSGESSFVSGIGLHLNALSTTSNNRVAQDTLTSGRRLISTPVSKSFSSITVGQITPNNLLTVKRDSSSTGSDVLALQVMQDSFLVPLDRIDDELNHKSPKKKKRKFEKGGETEGCKRCNCKKSKCLKLYCECFAAGVYCVEPCACQGCFNKPIHEATVLSTRKQIESRNPLAFAPKVIRTSESAPETGEEANKTPASARHKRGCNCKKSSCNKKYCECYQGGVGCSISCRCEGCKNVFGRKDGTLLIGNEETEHEEEDVDAIEKDGEHLNDGELKAEVQKDEQQFSGSVLQLTPFEPSRSSVKLSFFSSGKPPRSSVLSIGSSPLLKLSQTIGKSEIPSLSKLGKHFQIDPEVQTPEFLLGDASPISAVKNASPNRKRVSPPYHGIGSSPNHKGGRRLILKSIPSFPPLTGDVANEFPENNPESPFKYSLL